MLFGKSIFKVCSFNGLFGKDMEKEQHNIHKVKKDKDDNFYCH